MNSLLLAALSGTTSGTTKTLGENLGVSLEILWKGMLGIFVVIALIFVTIKILNAATKKRAPKKTDSDDETK